MEVVADQQAVTDNVSTSLEKSPLVGMASTAGSGSPGKPTEAATEPGKEMFPVAMEDDTSRSSTESILTVTTNPCSETTTNRDSEVVLTEDLVREEQKWAEEGAKEEEEELKKRTQLWDLMTEDGKEERYARLQFLLSKSNMYTEYLLGRMEEQKDLEKQRRDRMMKRKENKEKKEQEKMKAQEEKQETSTEGKEDNADKTKTEASTMSLRTTRATPTDSNIPKSPAVAATAEDIKSPRRKLPAPKPKSAIVGSPGSQSTEKENDNPDLAGSQTKGDNSPAEVTEEPEDFEDCLFDYLGDYVEEMKGPFDPSGSQSLRRGRKRKAAEDSKNLIVNFFQPTSKRKKAAPDEVENKTKEKQKTEENNEEEKDGKSKKKKKSKEEEFNFDEDPDPIIEEDGNVIRPALLMGGELRKYQVEGLNWLRVLYENGVNGILADEMGLGKTIQCIALIAHLGFNNIPGPFIVVAPLSTLPNWRSEFKKFAPRIPTLFYHGTYHERVKLLKKINKPRRVGKETYMRPVVITSYEMTIRDRKHLGNYEWRLMIVDEGHRIKNTQCRLIKELRQYNNTHRLLLTGTPLQNNLAELWSLLNFILPEIFDDMGSFQTWFDIAIIAEEGADEAIVEAEQRKNILSMLHQILMPFMLRRVKSDVDLLIPPKKELLVYAPMTQDQQEFYEATIDRTILQKIENRNSVKEVQELTETGRPRRRSTKKKINYQAMMASENDAAVPKNKRKDEEELEAWAQEMWDFNNRCEVKESKQRASQVTIRLQNTMMQLRKCCNHPYLLEYPLDSHGQFKVDENVITKCGKMIILDRMLAQLKRTGHKVLIFSQMTKMLDILEDFCIIRKMKYCRLDGQCSVTDRQEQMESFNTDPDMFVFLLSTRAGGLGINLTAADTVIIYDSDWNPQCDLQAQDRCHRIGQTRPVVIYRFVTANTIDQKIVERAAAKRKLEKMIIHKGKFKTGIRNFSREIKPLSPEELMELLKSRDHCKEVHKSNDFGITDQELDMLLDRSDMYEEFEKSKGSNDTSNQKSGDSQDTESRETMEVKQTCRLFKEVDYVQSGSTKGQEPQGEASEGEGKDVTVETGGEESDESTAKLLTTEAAL